MTAEEQLDFWESLGKLHDTYGLPDDLIWLKLRDTDRLPRNKQGNAMSGDEFTVGIKQAVKMIQVGGWRQVAEQMAG